MKNFLLKNCVRWIRSHLPNHPKANRILIVATTALGDTLWATPAIENIRRSFPSSYLAVLTSSVGKEIFKHNPHIDRIYGWPKWTSLYSLWRALFQERFDTVLLFHASQRIVLPLCALLGANRIIGTSGINKGLDELLTHPLPNAPQHEIVRRLKMAEEIGTKTFTETLSFYLQPEEIHPPLPPGRWVAIHPGSKDSFKRWPPHYFAQVGKALDAHILITGSGEEKALMEEIAAQIPGAQIAETNRSLRSFASVLNQMDLVISNDTGPFHLACALNRPVIGIYASTDPALCGPHKAPHALAIARRATCDPCLKRKCRQPFCFLEIGPQEVIHAAKNLLL